MNLRPFLAWLAPLLCPRPRVIYDRVGRSPYLTRYYLLGRPTMADGSSPIDRFGNPKEDAVFPTGLGLYIHHFHRSDDDAALHNHPWTWARALILAGGYIEERPDGTRPGPGHGFTTVRRVRKAGSWIRVNQDDFHRVDLLERDSWSLFIAGPKTASWGFLEPSTGDFLPWRDFIAKVRGTDYVPKKSGQPADILNRAWEKLAAGGWDESWRGHLKVRRMNREHPAREQLIFKHGAVGGYSLPCPTCHAQIGSACLWDAEEVAAELDGTS